MTQERANEIMDAVGALLKAIDPPGAWAFVLVDPDGPAPPQCSGSFKDQRDTAGMLRAMADALDAPTKKGDA